MPLPPNHNIPTELADFIARAGSSPLLGYVTLSDETRTTIEKLAARWSKSVDPIALQSALLLAVNALDESHSLSQEIHTEIGSYLHGVMHRREGDYGNANYWFHQARGFCPVERVSQLLSSDVLGILAAIFKKDVWTFSPIDLTDLHRRACSSKLDAREKAAVVHASWCEWTAIAEILIAD